MQPYRFSGWNLGLKSFTNLIIFFKPANHSLFALP
jgi:hypothetical protein